MAGAGALTGLRNSPNQVLTHAARAAERALVRIRAAWLFSFLRICASY